MSADYSPASGYLVPLDSFHIDAQSLSHAGADSIKKALGKNPAKLLGEKAAFVMPVLEALSILHKVNAKYKKKAHPPLDKPMKSLYEFLADQIDEKELVNQLAKTCPGELREFKRGDTAENFPFPYGVYIVFEKKKDQKSFIKTIFLLGDIDYVEGMDEEQEWLDVSC